MSSDDADGVMLVSEGGVYFIPLEDLAAYRLPQDVAHQARARLAPSEVSETGAGPDTASPREHQHRPSPAVVAPIRWPRQSLVQHDIMLHTATRW